MSQLDALENSKGLNIIIRRNLHIIVLEAENMYIDRKIQSPNVLAVKTEAKDYMSQLPWWVPAI